MTRRAYFSHKEFPVISAILTYSVRKNHIKPFTLIMAVYDWLLSIPKPFKPANILYKKNAIIRIVIFASLYYDNADYFLKANAQNTIHDTEVKLRTVFNLFFHFIDEFPIIVSPPYNLFKKLVQRNPQTIEQFSRVYLNKFTSVSNHSRNRRVNAGYFKLLFDLSMESELIDKQFINGLFWSIVTNQKEYMFDALDKDGYIYNPPDHEPSDTEFIIKLLRMKGKSPYDYMTYCNPHYQRYCLLLLV